MAQELVWGGAFLVSLPRGWRVSSEVERVEIVPETGDGAVHFSVVSRGCDDSVSEQIAHTLAALFLKSQKTTPVETPISVTLEGDKCSATATLPPREFQGGCWHSDMRVVVWPGRAVLGTYSWEAADERLREEGLSILRSIGVAKVEPEPDAPRSERSGRRWLRRREASD